MLTRRRLLLLGLAGLGVGAVGRERGAYADTGLVADRFALQTDTTPRIPASLRLRKPDGSFCTTTMEEYLRAVVPAEAIASWPMEALKAQAVAARTHAAIWIAAFGYVSTGAQAWVPSKIHPRSDEAIAATRDEILTYAGQMIWAEYSSSCGGQTDSRETQLAYLQPVRCAPERTPLDLSSEAAAASFWGGRPSSFCSDASGNPRFRYSSGRTRAEIEATIDRVLPGRRPGDLRDLVASVRAQSGRITRLTIVGSTGQLDVTTESTIVSILDPIVNTAPPPYEAEAKAALVPERDGNGNLVRISGTGGGWGHGRGMCQWGAKGMADAGYDYQRILAHYYSGTEPRRVAPTRSAQSVPSRRIMLPMLHQLGPPATPVPTATATTPPTPTPGPTCG